MLGSIRKFSTSIYAKILLGIVVIPFIFWGMGGAFVAGKKNVIVTIHKDKHTITEFNDFIQKFAPNDKKIDASVIENLLSSFIGDLLIKKEVERFDITLSNTSLSKIIKNQKTFKRDDKFSRVEYEKFLIQNNITPVNFENNLFNFEKKNQLLELIGGGILPSKFMIDIAFDKVNQKRTVQVINLNEIFKSKLSFSKEEIKSFYEKNKDNYKEIYKSINFLELNSKMLTGANDFNDLFFKKIDEIDDLIIQGKNLNNIIQKFNLDKPKNFTFNKNGNDKNLKQIKNFPDKLIENTYQLNEVEPIALIENNNKYYIIELTKTEILQNKLEDTEINKKVLIEIKNSTKRKLISELIAKIKQKSFKLTDFSELAKKNSTEIKTIKIKNRNDNNALKKDLVDQIYKFTANSIVVVHDLDFSENYLVYVDKIEKVSIEENSNEFEKYLKISKNELRNELYNTYDYFLKMRYKIDINYQALDTVKNFYTN